MPKNNSIKKKPARDLHTENLESGLYFLLNDIYKSAEEHSGIDDYIKNIIGSKIDHSNKKNPRIAIFLPFRNPDFFMGNLFSYKKECHITVDRNFIESDNHNQLDRRKWHYCHYTEEYAHGQIVHVYFNSLGQTIKFTLTDSAGISRELNEEEKNAIHFNIILAQNIVAELLAYKNTVSMQAASHALHLHEELIVKLTKKSTEDPLAQEAIETLYQQYVTVKEQAARYADQRLIFVDQEITELATSPRGMQTTVNYFDKNTRLAEPKENMLSKHQEQQNLILEQCRRQATKLIESAPGYEYLLEFEDLNAKLINLLHQKKLEQPIKEATNQLLQALTKKEREIRKSLKSHLHIDNITLDFLEKYFKYIDFEINNELYLKIIDTTINAPKKLCEKLSAICEYFASNSLFYNQIIKHANIANNENNNSQAFNWLLACFHKNNSQVFEMLLSHGLNLGATTIIEENQYLFYNSIFKVLIYQFDRTLSAAPTQSRQIILEKFKIFLAIMLKPNFMAGAEYEHDLRQRLPNKLTERKNHGKFINKIVEQESAISILDYVIKRNLPTEITGMIVAAMSSTQLTLNKIIRNFGIILTQYNRSIVINNPAQHTKHFTIYDQAEMSKISEFIGTIYEKPASGLINPCIYVNTENPKYASLQVSQSLLENFSKLLINKIQETLAQTDGYQQAITLARNILQLTTQPKQAIFEESYLLGVLLLTIHLPTTSQQFEHITLLCQVLLRLLNLEYATSEKVNTLFYGMPLCSLHDEVEKLVEKQPKFNDLFTNIKNEITLNNLPFNNLAAIQVHLASVFAGVAQRITQEELRGPSQKNRPS